MPRHASASQNGPPRRASRTAPAAPPPPTGAPPAKTRPPHKEASKKKPSCCPKPPFETPHPPPAPPAPAPQPAAVFHALASEARLCIVRELARHTHRCVGDLVGCCGLGWSTVSHHLAVLQGAGIIADQKSGQHVYYRLALPCVAKFVACLDAITTVASPHSKSPTTPTHRQHTTP